MLSSENYSKNKLAEILLSVSLSFKLPTEADTAICSIAYLIRDQADEDLSTTVSDKIIGRVIEELKKPVSKLNESITAAKSFLDTTLQQQASELINLHNSVKQHSNLAKTLADSSDKLSQVTTRNLDDASWPLLSPSGPPDSRPH
jgi:ABC-type transporter Mla subunit MlaD